MGDMGDIGDIGVLQQQLDEVREALRQARELIGTDLPAPPTGIEANPDAAQKWVV